MALIVGSDGDLSYYWRDRAGCARAFNARSKWWQNYEAAEVRIELLARKKLREQEKRRVEKLQGEFSLRWPRPRTEWNEWEIERARRWAAEDILGPEPEMSRNCFRSGEHARRWRAFPDYERDWFHPLIAVVLVTAIGGAAPWGLWYLLLWIVRGSRN